MRPLSRRAFVALAAAPAMPRRARGQSAERIRRLGWLGAIDGLKEPQAVAFVQRLRELGFADGSNLQITYRHAGGRAAAIACHGAPQAQSDLFSAAGRKPTFPR